MAINPVETAHLLFFHGFINEQTHSGVLTEDTTSNLKAEMLIQQSIWSITNHSEPANKLNNLLEILEKVNPVASFVAEKMRMVRTAYTAHTLM